jgi:hypothetical protein
MKTKLFTGLALAAAMLIGGPAFGYDNHKGGKSHAVAAVHRGGGGHAAVAVAHRGTSGRAFAVRSSRASRGTALASRRTFTAPAARGFASNRNLRGNSHTSVAFGGSGNSQFANNGHGHFAFASHSGWSHNRQYDWNGHHYGWYGNGWYIIDAYPAYGYGYGPGYGDYNGGSVAAQVQSVLYQQGYYQGPIDGVLGPGTQAAIAAYQRDNGLRVTGTITHGLLNELGVG